MADFAHSLRREVVEVNYEDASDLWFAENQPDAQGFDGPIFHVTRSRVGPAARVGAGDTIWLFAQLYTPWGKFPPALDAKVEVAQVDPRVAADGSSNGFRYKAGPGSMWFPLFDATKCLRKLSTRNARGATTSLLASAEQPVGRALRSMREIADNTPLLSHASALQSKPFEFISYRLIDGTQMAFKKALELVQRGRPVFWDRWSLPRRLAERREFLNDSALDDHIGLKIGEAALVWGMASPQYGATDSYSWKEMEMARKRGVLRLTS